MKKSYIHQSITEITVGFFVFAILGALILFTIVLSYDNIFTKSYGMQVKFDNVTGLIRGDKVYVQGVDVGRVNNLQIAPDGVMVDLTLKYDVNLREGYLIQVKSSSVLGGKYIEISEGPREAAALASGSEITGRAPVDFLEEASAALASIRSTLDEGGVLGNLEETMANLKVVTERLAKGEGTAGKFFSDDELYNEVMKTLAELRAMFDDLRETSPVTSLSGVFFGAF